MQRQLLIAAGLAGALGILGFIYWRQARTVVAPTPAALDADAGPALVSGPAATERPSGGAARKAPTSAAGAVGRDAGAAPATRPPSPMTQAAAAVAAAPTAPPAGPLEHPKPGMPNPGDVRDAVSAAKPAIGACYEDVLKSNAKAAGRLLVRFTLTRQGKSGRFKDAEIEQDDVGNPFLGMCVLKALSEAEYPAPEGGGELTVTFPFDFAPPPPDAGAP